MREIYVNLKLLAGQLELGETHRGLCPFCRGGSSGERSFALTRLSAGESLYICHRASCARTGRLASPGCRLTQVTYGLGSQQSPKPKPKLVFTGEIRRLGEVWLSKIQKDYSLSATDAAWAGWGETANGGDLAMPLRSPLLVRRHLEIRYYQPRIFGPRGKLKSKIYLESDAPTQSFFIRPEVLPDKVVVVEDQISALKASRQYKACALIGVHIGTDKLKEILGISKNIVLALDKDAVATAFKYQKNYSLYGNFRVAILDKDFKYEADERIHQIVEEAV